MLSRTTRAVQIFSFVGSFLFIAVGYSFFAQGATATVAAVGPYCRAGTASWDPLAASDLNLGWELDFTVAPSKINGATHSNGADYLPMIRLNPNSTADHGLNSGYKIINTSLSDASGQLGDLVTTYPGQVWVIGNEIDRVDVQDGLAPQAYAVAYHDIYRFIKQRDPTAQVAFSALVQVTPGRIQYLDIVWDTYKAKYGREMPVDVWTFHAYPLAEREYGTVDNNAGAAIALGTDPSIAVTGPSDDKFSCFDDDIYCASEHDSIDLFKEHVVRMRQWMKDNGQQNKPLLLTEFGILYPYQYPEGDLFYDEFGNTFTYERARDHLNRATSYLEATTDSNLGYPLDDYKLVQQWNWFMIHRELYDLGGPSSLITTDKSGLTIVGEAYRDSSAAESLYVDLVLESVYPGVGFTSDGISSDGNVTINARVRNVGTSRTNETISLELRNASNTLVATGTLSAPVRGCSVTVQDVDINWTTAPTGLSDVTVHLVSSEDNNSTDNTASTFVFLDPAAQVFLPLAFH